MGDTVDIPKRVWEAAVTLAGAEYRLRNWHIQSSDEEEGQVDHLRGLQRWASEIIRVYETGRRVCETITKSET